MERGLLYGAFLAPLERRFPLELQLYLGAALAPSMGAELVPNLELTQLLRGGFLWSYSDSLDRSCSGSFLELIRILLELIRLPLERKLPWS